MIPCRATSAAARVRLTQPRGPALRPVQSRPGPDPLEQPAGPSGIARFLQDDEEGNPYVLAIVRDHIKALLQADPTKTAALVLRFNNDPRTWAAVPNPRSEADWLGDGLKGPVKFDQEFSDKDDELTANGSIRVDLIPAVRDGLVIADALKNFDPGARLVEGLAALADTLDLVGGIAAPFAAPCPSPARPPTGKPKPTSIGDVIDMKTLLTDSVLAHVSKYVADHAGIINTKDLVDALRAGYLGVTVDPRASAAASMPPCRGRLAST